MTKVTREEYRETVSFLLSAHIASQRGEGLSSLSDDHKAKEVIDIAGKLALLVIKQSKNYPKKKSKGAASKPSLIPFTSDKTDHAPS